MLQAFVPPGPDAECDSDANRLQAEERSHVGDHSDCKQRLGKGLHFHSSNIYGPEFWKGKVTKTSHKGDLWDRSCREPSSQQVPGHVVHAQCLVESRWLPHS